MITKKLLLSVTVFTLLYSGCTEEEPKDVVESIQKTEVNAVSTPKKVTINPKETVEKTEMVTPIVASVKEVPSTPNATKLYNKCAACHGKNAEKSALSKSAIIKDWEASKIAQSLKGYKNGTYGGTMKGLMVAQVANLSDKEIDALSEHIANFN